MARSKTVAPRNPSEIPHRGISRCVFSTNYMAAVDEQVDNLFKSKGKRAPFGDFRRSWWRYHCRELDGPDACPYAPPDCALAFLRVAQLSADATRPGAMFRVIAKDHAIKRLERKPLARDQGSSTAPASYSGPRPSRGQEGARPDPGSVGNPADGGRRSRSAPGVQAPTDPDTVGDIREGGNTLRRPLSRPVRIGTLLGTHHPGSREVPPDDRGEGS